MFPFTIEQINEASQAIQMFGLKREHLADQAVRDELNRLWVQHGVIVFRGMEDSDELHIELSKVFGTFQVHPIKQRNTNPGRLELTNVEYAPGGENGSVFRVNGVELGAWLPLHTDLIYFDKLNHGGLLRPRQLPPVMGGTVFLDKIAVYDTLPDDLKQRIEGLELLHRFHIDLSKQRFTIDKVEKVRMGLKFQEIEAVEHKYPRSIHPLVYSQKETGRKMLNLSPWFADEILGMDPDESDKLLTELTRHVLTHPARYTHRWQEGDVVLWDNWRMLHGGEGVPPESGVRWLQRTTLAGDYELGRLEGAANSALELVDV